MDAAARPGGAPPRGYFVPVHLTDREGAPDVVAALEVQRDRLVVRGLVELRDAYPAARAVVERPADLPAWLVGA